MALPRKTAKPTAAPPRATPSAARLWLYHQPVRKPLDLKSLGAKLGEVSPVMTFETEAEGLVLLTNDTEVSRLMALPSVGWVRHYFLLSEAVLIPALLAELAAGPTIGGTPYGPVEVKAAAREGKSQWYAVTLREGRGRSLAALCMHYKIKVKRLARLGIGPFQLGELAPGAIEELPPAHWQAHLGGKFSRTS